MKALLALLERFRAWAPPAELRQEGWPAAFPAWAELLAATIDTMSAASPLDEAAHAAVEEVWALATDPFAQTAVGQEPGVFRDWVRSLALSSHAPVRRQAYPVLGRWRLDRALLAEAARGDPDAEARRCAAALLGELDPFALAGFSDDADEQMKLIAFQAVARFFCQWLEARRMDPSPLVQARCAELIRRICPKSARTAA